MPAASSRKPTTPRRFAEAGIAAPFVQDNHSLSAQPAWCAACTARSRRACRASWCGWCKGAIWDVAVDIRHGSPTYGRHVAAELSAANWSQLWVPGGFLHGFCTLQPDTEVIYKVTAGYDRARRARGDLERPRSRAALAGGRRRRRCCPTRTPRLPRLADCDAWFRV